MVKKQDDRGEFEEKLDYYKLAVSLKPISEDEKEPEYPGNNKDYVWWLI